MVTDVSESEVVEQAEVETDTEEAPVLELEAPAAQTADAPAMAEEEKPLTRADLEAELSRVREEARQQARQDERRQFQREADRRTAERERDQAERAELHDSIKTTLGAEGVFLEKPEVIGTLIERSVGKRTDAISSRTLADVADAFTAAAAEAVGASYDGELTAKAASYISNFKPFIEQLIQNPQVKDKLIADERKKWEAGLPKLVDAEIARRNSRNREGKTELNRPNGQSPDNIDRSIAAVNARVSKGTHDEEDQRLAREYIARIRNR